MTWMITLLANERGRDWHFVLLARLESDRHVVWEDTASFDTWLLFLRGAFLAQFNVR